MSRPKRIENTDYQRRCSGTCAKILPLTDEFFYRKINGTSIFQYKCKPCLRAVTKVQSKNRRDKARLKRMKK